MHLTQMLSYLTKAPQDFLALAATCGSTWAIYKAGRDCLWRAALGHRVKVSGGQVDRDWRALPARSHSPHGSAQARLLRLVTAVGSQTLLAEELGRWAPKSLVCSSEPRPRSPRPRPLTFRSTGLDMHAMLQPCHTCGLRMLASGRPHSTCIAA